MSIIGSNILAGASGQATGYNINNSLRFRSSASASLSRTPASSGNRKTWTWSAWVKRGTLSVQLNTLLVTKPASSANDNNTLQFSFNSDNALTIGLETAYYLTTTQVFRDTSAWYHIVLAVDTTQATASNRVKIYINGTQVTAFSVDLRSSITQNQDLGINLGSQLHQIGSLAANTWYFDGYMADINFIDGSAKAASDFGETDTTTGSWKPKAYTSTYGTNGFYLKFSDIATTSGSNAGLGKDFSGNANYWTTNNISVTAGTTYDAMLDVPTNTSATVANYCTLNPLRYGITYVPTLSEGNLKVAWAGDASVIIGTMNIPSSGKWYWEAVVPTQTYNFLALGVVKNQETSNLNTYLGSVTTGYGVYVSTGQKLVAAVSSTYMAIPAQNTVVTVAFDADTGTLYIGAGGSWANGSGSTNQTFSTATSIVTGLTGDISPAFSFNTGNVIVNFGQRPFSYTPPTGYVALNTYNLPDSTIKKGNTVMDATLYTGTGASLSVTNAGAFKPDFVWVKGRSGATDHAWYDSVRGTTKQLESNTQTAETTEATGLTAFGTSGFTVGALAQMNTSAATYVGWQWQAGQGSTTTGTGTGGITSVTQSVNATAGFSIVTYTGSGSNGTVTHGLGVAPKMIIVRIRDGTTNNWRVYNSSLTSASYFLYLNGTQAEGSDSTLWNSTAPTSSVFSLGTNGDVNASTYNYVAYCWAEIAGFSKFGSYTGNGSTDGPMIFTGFTPKFLMFKRTDTTSGWYIYDSSRNTSNVVNLRLLPNTTDAEATVTTLDFLSNGFKLRTSDADRNASGGTYIYACFASNPFRNSNAF